MYETENEKSKCYFCYCYCGKTTYPLKKSCSPRW